MLIEGIGLGWVWTVSAWKEINWCLLYSILCGCFSGHKQKGIDSPIIDLSSDLGPAVGAASKSSLTRTANRGSKCKS